MELTQIRHLIGGLTISKNRLSAAILFIILAMLCIATQPLVQAGSSDDWPMFCHDPAHTGATTSTGPTNLTELWSYKEEIADTHFSASSSPAVVNGIAYFCSNWDGKTDYGGRIYALNAYTGAKIWSFSIDNDHVSSSPAVSENRLFIGVRNDVIALDALSGAKIWNYTTGGVAVFSPVVTGGIVFVSSYNDDVYALNASTGAKIWNYTTEKISGGYGVNCSPAVSNGIVYVGSDNLNLYALDALNGTRIWNTKVGCSGSSPSVSGGMVYIGSWTGYVYALNALTGKEIWRFHTWHFDGEMGVVATPAVADGIVYIGSEGIASFYALNASTGEQIWNGSPSMVRTSAVVAGGIVYLDTLLFNASTGTSIAGFYENGESYSSSAVVDGVLYVASTNGTFYALGEPSTDGVVFPIQTLLIALLVSIVMTITVVLVFVKRQKTKKVYPV